MKQPGASDRGSRLTMIVQFVISGDLEKSKILVVW